MSTPNTTRCEDCGARMAKTDDGCFTVEDGRYYLCDACLAAAVTEGER